MSTRGSIAWSGSILRFFGLRERTVNVPPLNEKIGDFEWLFGTITEIEAALSSRPGLRIIFDFSLCTFLQQNAVILLGGLARIAEQRGGQIIFKWDTLQPDVRKNLQ